MTPDQFNIDVQQINPLDFGEGTEELEARRAEAAAEEQMQAQDAELRELGKARDELESYIYEMRRVLSGSPHMSLLDSDTLSPLLTAAEDWMYETPDEYTRESYTEKRSELETAFEQKRLQLEEARNRKATALVSSAERMLKSILSCATTRLKSSTTDFLLAATYWRKAATQRRCWGRRMRRVSEPA